MIDHEGVITHKFFESSLAVRVGPQQLLAAAMGEYVETERFEPTPAEAVTVDVSIDGRDLPPGMQRDVVVRFSVPPGQHLYGEPAPEGLVAATVDIDDAPGVMTFETTGPATRPLTLTATGETLQVYEGDVTLRRPLAQNGTAGEKIDGQRMITVRGEVRWQACDDSQCGLPERHRFELRIPAGRIMRPDIGPAGDSGQAVPMNGAEHFQRMVERRRSTG